MYNLKATRLQQVSSCNYKQVMVTIGNPHNSYIDLWSITKTLNEAGYDNVTQHFNGTDTKNLFFHCVSTKKYPLGHKFHEISVTAIPN